MLIRSIEPERSVLDIGCGTGSIAKTLVREKRCEAFGVDMLPAEMGPDVLRKYWSIDLNQNLERLSEPLAERHYDYIVLADILEHMVDPERFLEMLRAHCRTSADGRATRVHATTGNVGFFVVQLMLLFGQFNYGPKGILDRTHTRLFTRKSFAHVFSQCGFKICRIESNRIGADAVYDNIFCYQSRGSLVGARKLFD